MTTVYGSEMFWFAASVIAIGIIVYFVVTTTLEEWYAKKDREHIPTLRNIAESARIEREADRCISFRVVPAPPYDWAREQDQSIGTALESVDGPGETVDVLLTEQGLRTVLEGMAVEPRPSQRERVDR